MGFQDEVWWSRVTQPHLRAWADADSALRLVEQNCAYRYGLYYPLGVLYDVKRQVLAVGEAPRNPNEACAERLPFTER